MFGKVGCQRRNTRPSHRKNRGLHSSLVRPKVFLLQPQHLNYSPPLLPQSLVFRLEMLCMPALVSFLLAIEICATMNLLPMGHSLSAEHCKSLVILCTTKWHTTCGYVMAGMSRLQTPKMRLKKLRCNLVLEKRLELICPQSHLVELVVANSNSINMQNSKMFGVIVLRLDILTLRKQILRAQPISKR